MGSYLGNTLKKGWIFFVAAVAFTGMILWALAIRFPGSLDGRGDRIGLTSNLVWLAVLGGALAVHFRARPSHALKSAAIWVAIGSVLILTYSFRHDAADLIGRFRAELLPSSPVMVEKGAVSFRAGNDGHFIVEAEVDGTRLRFLVDTGATGVVLSPADARRLGFDLTALSYTQPAQTANGLVYGAPVRLRNIRIGTLVVLDIGASVNGAEMKHSLLGMSLLNRLGGYDVRDGILTFRP